ncbi:DUF456 domain-containing protein [Alkaliphilus peptidifermentans]|uniref:DUF456 domain-containing protein n=1 Tax=Alkaliphilus peptidifermentans DSM 18978 TaxID=1120976 RepID=A0A1G5K318_9FIRM|nr:DUF456 domain-containing protein [Alkaliphilus peptidifermentans]SCY95003.1 hypothetical protein SAMN03080606_03216 [Alkaliphilus peptidifermentans DSM 18978]
MQNVYILISIVLILFGTVGIFTAMLPGPVLVLLGVVIYSWATGFAIISMKVIIFFALLTLIGILADYLASFITAKKFGISRLGFIGMMIGGIVGLIIFNILGLLLGQFFGAILGELLSGKYFSKAALSGSAAIIGYFISVLINITVVGIMLGFFVYLIVKGGVI